MLNISSGLGRRAMAGQATYCAAKAGMDHLSRAVALDQALVANGAKIVSLAPGVIDTDMQVFLRKQDPAAFPEGHYFRSMKDEVKLVSADAVAQKIAAYLDRADFGAHEIDDIRNL